MAFGTGRGRSVMRALFPTARSDPELAPFRPGLVFAFFNAIAWQIGIGTPMVLFAEELGATPLDGDDADWMRFELEQQEALDAMT